MWSSYQEMYMNGSKEYWRCLSAEIETYCLGKNIAYQNYFYHEKLVREKRNK